MQLSDDQIQYLFKFTEKKSVRWYDLQIELVDHLASRIEEEMDTDKAIGFETALEKVYKEFGLFGFSKIIQAKQAELQRGVRKIWWREVRGFFSWPKVILLALIVAVLWTLSQMLPLNFLMIGFLVAYIIVSLVVMKSMFQYKKARRKLLLLEFGSTYLSSSIFFYELLVFSIIDNVSAIVFCIYATIGIVFLAASVQLYRKVKEKAVNLYPATFA